MKKLIVGLAAIGGIIALRSVAGQASQKMQEHCKQMAGKCKQMMAGQSAGHSEMREHCQEMMASHGRNGEEAATPERSAQEAPQSVAGGEAVAV